MSPRAFTPPYAHPDERCGKTGLLVYGSEQQARRAAIGEENINHAGPDGGLIVKPCGGHFHLYSRKKVSRTLDKPKRKQRRRNSGRSKGERWTRVEWDEATLQLWGRQHGNCARCGDPLAENADRHHRLLRSQGGDDRLSNLVLLHPHCHDTVHEHPIVARAAGLIISASDPRKPQDVPITLPDQRVWLLRDDGSMRPAA